MHHERTSDFVLTLFSDTLGREDIDLDDDFLECGGNSLMAARVLTLLRSEYDIDIGLSAFLEQPTARRLATLVEAALMQLPAGAAVDGDQGDEDTIII